MKELKIFEQNKHTKYYIDNLGNTYSSSDYNSNGELRPHKQTLNRGKYLYVRTLQGNYQVHRLVAKYFIPNPHNKKVVNHIDGNKQNNNMNNLEWVTHKENTQHAMQNGLIKLSKKGSYKKYTQEQYNDVLKMIKSGMTYSQAGEKYNMPYSTVAHFIRGSRGVKNEN